jgi:hypothetical protein
LRGFLASGGWELPGKKRFAVWKAFENPLDWQAGAGNR